jgi:molybdate transport system substrate-binding protein
MPVHTLYRRSFLQSSAAVGSWAAASPLWLGSTSQAASNLPEPLMQTIRIVAASDLQFALPALLNQFQQDTGLPCVATYGSSGQLARQIAQGLPADLFMSADESLVTPLVQQKRTKNEGAVYATGRLALLSSHTYALAERTDWPSALAMLRSAVGAPLSAAPSAALASTPTTAQSAARSVSATRAASSASSASNAHNGARDSAGNTPLARPAPPLRQFAIANPAHAPYGRAAQQALQTLGLWSALQPRLVLGDNIAQATQFVRTGAAQAGLVAWSLALAGEVAATTRFTLVPADLHSPLRQRLVILQSAKPQTQQLVDYLLSAPVRARLATQGFE